MSTITLSERLSEIQKELGVNSNVFAKMCGLSAPMMTRYLNGKYTNPTLSSLKAIADNLGYTLSYIMGENTTYNDSGDFVRIFRWTLDQYGERARSSQAAMVHKDVLKQFNVNEDLLDVVVMPNDSMSPIINEGDDMLCYAVDESKPTIKNGSLYLFTCNGYVYVGYITRNFDGTLSIWTEQNKEKQSISPDKLTIKYHILMRSGVVA